MNAALYISVPASDLHMCQQARARIQPWLVSRGLDEQVICHIDAKTSGLWFEPQAALLNEPWLRHHDTLSLRQRFDLDDSSQHLERETVMAMIASPLTMAFPSVDEFFANVQARGHIARMAGQAQLRFDTEAVDRPTAFWRYDEAQGFVLKPGCDLLEALQAALVPDAHGHAYSFSCYRASEYVMLYGIAQVLKTAYPDLYAQLQMRWRISPIASRRFHDTFVHEVGSTDAPLPQGFYIPGDRVWFRNPDEASADVPGYEGSWVIYLGGGLFCNFWQAQNPFTLTDKCLEIYCWRHAVRMGSDGQAFIDEPAVSAEVAELKAGAAGPRQAIIERMMRYRDVSGTYAQGGCIDSTREFINHFQAGTPRLQF